MDDDSGQQKVQFPQVEPIYLNPEDVPVCIMKKGTMVKPPEDCHTRYGVVDDPWEMKYLYEYFKEKFD